MSRIALLLLLICQPALAVDIHALWDDRCEECHGHSADFARRYLWVENDQLKGRHHIDNLRLFMRHHYTPEYALDDIYQMLREQADSPPRFRRECAGCHGSAAQFARQSIVSRSGQLFGVDSGIRVDMFLQSHRGLDAEDIGFYLQMLERLVRETR